MSTKTNEKVYILNKAKLGETLVVSLGETLPDHGFSRRAYDEEKLKDNPEILSLLDANQVELIKESDKEKVQTQQESTKRKDEIEQSRKETVESALEKDVPPNANVRTQMAKVERALQDLKKAITDAVRDSEVPTFERFSSEQEKEEVPNPKNTNGKKDSGSEDDDLGIPTNPPAGMTPRPYVEDYLKKPAKDRKEFLKNSKDIAMLREIAMFEGAPKIKKQARKRVKELSENIGG